MDKYEYRIKADQIKKLVSEENYISAMKIADTIDWSRVKNVSMLCAISDIYEKNEKYEESHEVLLMAYDRSPIGRMMVYKLAELAIKMEDYEEAIDYYREFVHLSPGDLAADILKYKIYKAKGTSAEELIPIMKAFKEKEYHEEWAYELARLYHEAGMGSKCVEECDELILWFSEGKFVEKAMELKMLYRPLSPEQQEKYDHRNDVHNEIIEYFDEEDEQQEESINELDTSKVVVMTEDMFSDAVDANDIQIKQINVGKYDTINLQAELAKSMEQIMSATEKEAVDSTMENIRRMVEDSQILDINFDEELEKNEIKPDIIQVEVPVQMEVNNSPAQERVSFDKVLAEENDGQISLYMPEANILEKQITGQMRIEDVLSEWEKMKSAAQVAIKEAEQKRLNEVKSRALDKAQNIMSKLALIISEEEMKVNGQEIAAALEASFLEEDSSLFQIAASLESVGSNSIPEYVTGNNGENEFIEDLNLVDELGVDNISDDLNVSNDGGMHVNTIYVDDSNIENQLEELIEEDYRASLISENEKLKRKYKDEMLVSEAINQLEIQNSQLRAVDEDDSVARAIEDRITASFPADIEALIADEFEEDEKEEKDLEDAAIYRSGLTKEQQELFVAFLSVRGIEKSLCRIFEPMNIANSNNSPFEVNNITVIGSEQTGKTTLGMAIAKAVQMAQHKKSGKVAKITGSSLNTKEIRQLTDKMYGGVLIIEKAGDITEKTIKSLMEAMREAKEEIMLILEDTRTGIESVLGKDKDFANQFKVKVELPEYNNDELVEFGKEYAKTLMYSFDDMAILAFYTCLGNIQNDDSAVTIEQVREIVDAAIKRSNKKKFKKLKDIIMSRRFDEDKRVILQESDFEGII
jgi:tetratricopeptide (TPR) repeat protein